MGRPEVFAGNRLVLAVPAGSHDPLARRPAQARRDDRDRLAARPGRRLHAQGARPAAGAGARRRSSPTCACEEPDVKGIVGKLTQGAVDAGFVYVTDVARPSGALKAIELPADGCNRRSPTASRWSRARSTPRRPAFIDGLLDGAGAQALRQAGLHRADVSGARGWFAAVLVVALAVTLAFLTLPVVAIFVDTGPPPAGQPRRPGRARRAAG